MAVRADYWYGAEHGAASDDSDLNCAADDADAGVHKRNHAERDYDMSARSDTFCRLRNRLLHTNLLLTLSGTGRTI